MLVHTQALPCKPDIQQAPARGTAPGSAALPMCERKAPPVHAAEQAGFTLLIYTELWHTV